VVIEHLTLEHLAIEHLSCNWAEQQVTIRHLAIGRNGDWQLASGNWASSNWTKQRKQRAAVEHLECLLKVFARPFKDCLIALNAIG
jgi:hypothetical protein